MITLNFIILFCFEFFAQSQKGSGSGNYKPKKDKPPRDSNYKKQKKDKSGKNNENKQRGRILKIRKKFTSN